MEPEPFFVRPGALLSLLAVTLVLTGGYYMFRRFDVVGPLERPKLGTDGSGVAAAASPRTWPAVRERLTLDPRFVGVELPDQVGLLPLGQNGRTRLEEFAVEGTGAVPSEATRDAEGVLPITDEDAIVLVLVPPGSFQMGSPPGVRNGDGRPQHLVTFSQPFFIARTELTNAQLRAVPVGRNSSDARLPAAGVSWHDFVGHGSTFGLRLPTESEWEYACRAGTTTEYSFGNDAAGLATHGWYFINSGTQPLDEQTEWKFGNLDEWGCRAHPVGDATKLANPWGLHDMHGNVWEWCADSWHWNYEGAPNDGSQRLDQESPDRVVRGGAFDTPAGHLRSASRRRSNAAEPSRSVGARYARSVATN
ncbi:MAG: formylglycine-generating enzyme family protein [Planctomycetes bacterium]|nr:formylglycine-generating enzyme family protein [Planctomycetota bacterium]